MPQVGAVHRGVGRKTWRAVALGRLPPPSPQLPSYKATVYCISSTRALILSLPLRLTRNCCITKRSCWTMETNGKLKLLQIYRQTSCIDRLPVQIDILCLKCQDFVKIISNSREYCAWQVLVTGQKLICCCCCCCFLCCDSTITCLFAYELPVWNSSLQIKWYFHLWFVFVQTILCTLPKVLRTDSRRKTTHPCACRQPVHGLH